MTRESPVSLEGERKRITSFTKSGSTYKGATLAMQGRYRGGSVPYINRRFVVALFAGLAVLVGGAALNRAGSPEPSAPSAPEHPTGCAAPAPASAAGAAIELHPYAPADAAITFVCCAYNPSVVTITVGESATWSGAFSPIHPMRQVTGPTSDTPVPGGFANSTGTFYAFQFNTPGTYYYHCSNHGVAQFGGTMRGSVVVLPIAEVSNSLVITGAQISTLSWSNSQGPFNVYRGVYAGSWAYNQTCFDPNTTGPSIDAAVPPAGTMYYYLVSRMGTGGGESALGRDSADVATPNTSPCP